jgi:hypothetical protein
MAYALSFGPEFYWGEHSPDDAIPRSRRPTNVVEALASLSNSTWSKLARRVFSCRPDYLDLHSVMQRIEETNTCLNLDSPVEVLIDRDGEFTIRVFDRRRE